MTFLWETGDLTTKIIWVFPIYQILLWVKEPEKIRRLYTDNAAYENTSPVITTAITVLIARIMKNISETLDFDKDTHIYKDLIIHLKSTANLLRKKVTNGAYAIKIGVVIKK